MSKPIKQHAEALAEAVTEVLQSDPSVEEEVLETAMREILVSQRSILNLLLRDDIISDVTYAQLKSEVDIALTSPDTSQLEFLLRKTKDPIRGLMTIIVQKSDAESVIAILNRLGTPITRFSSSGGFLGKENTTLLVGVPEGKDQVILDAISKASRQRIEHIPGLPDHADFSTSITVQGATIFTFDVERFEEI
jgi:uncharacterized protein YaaQ